MTVLDSHELEQVSGGIWGALVVGDIIVACVVAAPPAY